MVSRTALAAGFSGKIRAYFPGGETGLRVSGRANIPIRKLFTLPPGGSKARHEPSGKVRVREGVGFADATAVRSAQPPLPGRSCLTADPPRGRVKAPRRTKGSGTFFAFFGGSVPRRRAILAKKK